MVRRTDRPNMTIAVDWDTKIITKQKKNRIKSLDIFHRVTHSALLDVYILFNYRTYVINYVI